MEIKATLKQVHPVVEKNNFKSQKFWVTYSENPEYPQTIEMELQQGKCGALDGVAIGAPITLHFNLRGREWTKPETQVTSVFNSLVCWKVEAAGVAQQPAMQAPVLPVDDPGDSLSF